MKQPKHTKPTSRTATIATKVTPAMLTRLEAIAGKQGRSLSALAQDALIMYVAQSSPAGTLTMEDL